jgi:transcriptional regulatory protein LevR
VVLELLDKATLAVAVKFGFTNPLVAVAVKVALVRQVMVVLVAHGRVTAAMQVQVLTVQALLVCIQVAAVAGGMPVTARM